MLNSQTASAQTGMGISVGIQPSSLNWRIGLPISLLTAKGQVFCQLACSVRSNSMVERPLQFLQSSNYTHHRDIRVAHIMTPWDALTAVEWRTLQLMCAGDLLDLL